MKRSILVLLFIFLIASFLWGCTNDATNENVDSNKANQTEVENVSAKSEEPLEPVTIRIAHDGGYFTEEDFDMLISEPVQKTYSHITIEHEIAKMDDILMTKAPIDFYATWNGDLPNYKDVGIYHDITPLADSHGLDLSLFDQQALDVVRNMSDDGDLFAIPYADNIGVLYYNKNIFDIFGVPYPEDGMTWEDAIELARQVSRTEDGVVYSGLFTTFGSLISQQSLNYIDARTDEVLVSSEPYKRTFEIGKELYSLPNNEYFTGNGVNEFAKEQTLAMLSQGNFFLQFKDTPGLEWDVAQRPSFKEQPDIYAWFNLHLLIPMKTSKHYDDQLRVLEVLFSDEVQTDMVSKTLRKSVLSNPKYLKLFGSDYAELQGKRMSSIFKSRSGPAPELSEYWSKASSLGTAEFRKVVAGEKDVNTALRDLEAEIQRYIETQKE